MDSTAIVPTLNGRRRLESLLPQLSEFRRVLVVDNGSSDGSADAARDHGAEVIRFPDNRGFCRAVNSGIAACDTPLLAVINDDVRLQPGWLTGLRIALDGAWFATGRILSASHPGRIDGSFDAVARSGCAWRCGQGRPDGPQWRTSRAIAMVPFTAALFRTDLFRLVGTLDERLESYLEDVDFGLRCASKGYSGVYVPGVVAWHEGSATLGRWNHRTVRQISRNQLFLVSKHYSRKALFRYGWPIALGQVLWGFVALKHGVGLAWVHGKVEGLRRFSSFRGEPLAGLDRILAESERTIHDLQRASGYDAYWRAYFALTWNA